MGYSNQGGPNFSNKNDVPPADSIQINVTEVIDGTPRAVLFVGDTGLLADDPNFLYVEGTGAAALSIYSSSNTATTASGYSLFKQRASGAAVQNGDRLGVYSAAGYDGSAYQTNGAIRFAVDGTVAAGQVPTNIEFWTSATNAVSLSRKMYLTSGGDWYLGATSTSQIYAQPNFSSLNFPLFVATASNGINIGASHVFNRYRASSTAVAATDQIGTISFGGYDGSALQYSCVLEVEVDGAVSAGVVPIGFQFNTGTSTGTASTRMYINSTGEVGIGYGGIENPPTGLLGVRAQSALSTYSVFGISDSTDAAIFVVDGVGRLQMGQINFNISIGSDTNPDLGTDNISIGADALKNNDGACLFNVSIGSSTLTNASGAEENVMIGYFAAWGQSADVTGDRNVVVGAYAAANLTSGEYNVIIGHTAGGSSSFGDSSYNTIVGGNAASGNVNINGAVYLGYYTGAYETGDNKLFIDNQDRTNEATARTNSLVYGVFNATPASQTITFNAVTTSTYNLIGKAGVIFDSIQSHTSGASVTISDNNRGLYVNPASTLAALTITLPANPVDGQEIIIHFGGTLTSGAVVTALTLAGSGGSTILNGSSITTAQAGDGYILKYQATGTLWRIL